MDTDKTDKLIAHAIAALPYRRPSVGFSARVMAGIMAAGAPQRLAARVFEATGLIITTWVAALSFISAKLVYANLADMLALFIQPGGSTQAFNLLAAHAALILAKLAAAALFASDLLSAAAVSLPVWYEIAAATLLCSVAIAALSKGGRVSA